MALVLNWPCLRSTLARYTWNLICADIDECDKRRHNCSDDGAKCHNTPGSYLCSCLEGYAGDGFNCTGVLNIVNLHVSILLFEYETFLSHE